MSSARYEPVSYGDDAPEYDDLEGGRLGEGHEREQEEQYVELDADIDSNERDSLVPRIQLDPAPNTTSQPSRFRFLSLFSSSASSTSALRPSPDTSRLFVSTPHSADGVFTNIPAKPTSSRDIDRDDEEMGPEEWIFMSPEQRSKLPPPVCFCLLLIPFRRSNAHSSPFQKYSKIKRDRAPHYTPTYIPPPPPPSSSNKRARPVHPRINTRPAGSPSHFILCTLLCTIIPLAGFTIAYLVTAYTSPRFRTHASRLGCRTGLGLSMFHIAAIIVYIPLCVFRSGYFPRFIGPITSILFTLFICLPFGWPLVHSSTRSYLWLRAQERVFAERLARQGFRVSLDVIPPSDQQEPDENAYRYIEGTDLRVKDLKKALARARDARLARSLRAAGF